MLLRDVRLVPVGGVPAASEPVDVSTTGGVVTAVGPGLPAEEEVIEGEGRWLIPGLWDQHTHLGQWTSRSHRLSLAGVGSVDEAVRRVRGRLAENPGKPVIGFGHRPAQWPTQPTVADLDSASPEIPVVLISGDGHHAWLNTPGLRALGLSPRTDVVAEAEWFAAYPRMGELAGDSMSPAAYRETLLGAASRGVVGVVDFEFGAPPSAWVSRWADGADVLRVRAATYAETLPSVVTAGTRTGDALSSDGLLTMGPLKIISDGSLNTRTAWCCEPYAGSSSTGAPNLSPDDLSALLRRAHAAGLDVATHAIGDAAVGAALSAYAEVGARGSIEHAQLVHRNDVACLAALGLRASVQPAHLLDDRDVVEQYWPDRADRVYAFRWMLDAGVSLAFGSDAPVSPLDPWLAIAAAVHRSGDERDAWHPEQALTVAEALAASTDGLGTVAAGHPADLALCDRDPLADADSASVAAEQLRSMTVSATLVAGRLVHG